MAAKRKTSWLVALVALFASTTAFASIDREAAPPVRSTFTQRVEIFEQIEASDIAASDVQPTVEPPDVCFAFARNADDEEPKRILREALATVIDTSAPAQSLSETRVWGPEVLDSDFDQEHSLLSRVLHRGSAVVWPGIASDRTVLSPDPLGYRDSSNMYAFAGGDPVNGRDPRGEGAYWEDRSAEIVRGLRTLNVMEQVDPSTFVRRAYLRYDLLKELRGVLEDRPTKAPRGTRSIGDLLESYGQAKHEIATGVGKIAEINTRLAVGSRQPDDPYADELSREAGAGREPIVGVQAGQRFRNRAAGVSASIAGAAAIFSTEVLIAVGEQLTADRVFKALGEIDEINLGGRQLSGKIHGHHTIPREILKSLPPEVADNPLVRGSRGSPNIWSIPEELHKAIHRGRNGGLYNELFKEELKALGRTPTAQDVVGIRDQLTSNLGLAKYRR